LRSPCTGKLLPNPDLPAALDDRARKFERVERIATRGLVEPPKQRSRERDTDLRPQQTADRTGAQGAEPNRPNLLAGHCVKELVRGFLCVRSRREQQLNRLLAQPPHGKCERESRIRVEPLDVIDGHEDRPVARQLPQHAQDRRAGGPAVWRRAGRIHEEKCDFERTALRRRQRRQDCFEHVTEEVADAGE
jgi:hypothetical protein